MTEKETNRSIPPVSSSTISSSGPRLTTLRPSAGGKPKFAPRMVARPRVAPKEDKSKSVASKSADDFDMSGFWDGNRSHGRGRGRRGGRDGRGRGRGAQLPSGRVAFVGATAAGSSTGSSSRPALSKQSSAASGEGISIVMAENGDATEQPLDMEIDNTPWPPIIKSELQPMDLPFGRPWKSVATATPFRRGNQAVDRIFYDENGKQIIQDDELFLVQLPTLLPYRQSDQTTSTNENLQDNPVKVKTENPNTKEEKKSNDKDVSKTTTFEKIPKGYFGKMQIHKSGKVTLNVGGKPFEVAAGIPFTFLQDVASLHPKKKEACILGSISRYLVITPDFDSLIESSSIIM